MFLRNLRRKVRIREKPAVLETKPRRDLVVIEHQVENLRLFKDVLKIAPREADVDVGRLYVQPGSVSGH